MGAAVLGSAMGEVWGGEEGTQLRSRISSFIRRARLRGGGARRLGWVSGPCGRRPSAPASPPVSQWGLGHRDRDKGMDKGWLSCGCAPGCGGTCVRTATVLLAVLVGVDDGLGVWRVCVGRLLARVACRG